MPDSFRSPRPRPLAVSIGGRVGSESPVIIRHQQRAIGVAQFQGWILEHRVQAKLGERWADAAHSHSRVVRASTQDKPADHDVVPCFHEAARADVGQLRIRRLVEIVGFDDSDAAGVILSGQRRRVIAGGKTSEHDGLAAIARLEGTSFKLRTSRTVEPVVVVLDGGVRVPQLENRIEQDVVDSKEQPAMDPWPGATPASSAFPVMMKPAIMSLSPVPTLSRVEIFSD